MPIIDLGSVVGPQGPQGVAGSQGAQGIQGNPGPSQVTASTNTSLSGILQGNGSKVSALASDASPTAGSNNAIRSGAVFSALQAKSNFNFLDNWLFIGGGSQLGSGIFPINRRGQLIKSGNGYLIDRWFNDGGSTVSSQLTGAGLVLSTNGNHAYIGQNIEWAALKNQIVTYSVLFISDGTTYLATGSGTMPGSTPGENMYTVVLLNSQVPHSAGCGLYVFTSGYCRAQFGVANGHSVTLLAAKVELGTMQTLAQQVNGVWTLIDAPNFEEQMLRCCTNMVDPGDTYTGNINLGNHSMAWGAVSGSNKPYLRFDTPGNVTYQFVVNASNQLVVEKIEGGTVTTIARYAPLT